MSRAVETSGQGERVLKEPRRWNVLAWTLVSNATSILNVSKGRRPLVGEPDCAEQPPCEAASTGSIWNSVDV